jgi:hypothetical protein
MIVRMMTHELEVSILAAPLAQMDRRALSQAWYTALRLAPQTTSAPRPATLAQSGPLTGTAHSLVTNQRTARRPNAFSPAATFSSSRRGATGFGEVQGPARPARGGTLAERIERTFAGSPLPAKRATFSLGRGNARIHIILQTIAERPTLVALCRPELRTVVGRALAQARLGLARRGIGVELCTVGDRVCF